MRPSVGAQSAIASKRLATACRGANTLGLMAVSAIPKSSRSAAKLVGGGSLGERSPTESTRRRRQVTTPVAVEAGRRRERRLLLQVGCGAQPDDAFVAQRLTREAMSGSACF